MLFLGMVAMQRIVKPRDHPRRIAKGRMLGDVFYALAVDPHLSAVIEAVEKLLTRIGKRRDMPWFSLRRRVQLNARCGADLPAQQLNIAATRLVNVSIARQLPQSEMRKWRDLQAR